MSKEEEDHIGNEIEFISHGEGSKIIGSCWMNYTKNIVEASDDALLQKLKDTRIPYEYKGQMLVLTMERHGTIFLDELPNYYQSYIAARKKR